MLDIEGCRPFQLLNLGRYERQHWQVNVLNGHEAPEYAVAEYYRFILGLYHAEAVGGHAHLHGRKAGRMTHVGPADAPVTRDEVTGAVRECEANRYTALDVLGWEWEHGLHDTVRDDAKAHGVDLRLLVIPREVMDSRAVERGDVRFYELAYLKAVPEIAGLQVVVRLDDFIIPSPELVPDDVRAKIKRWSDYVDFWAVDWNFGAIGGGGHIPQRVADIPHAWRTGAEAGERPARLSGGGDVQDSRESDRHLWQRHDATPRGGTSHDTVSSSCSIPYAVPSSRRPSRAMLVPKIRTAVDQWRTEGYPGATETTRRLLRFWFEQDHKIGHGKSASKFGFYFCQREAIEDAHLPL